TNRPVTHCKNAGMRCGKQLGVRYDGARGSVAGRKPALRRYNWVGPMKNITVLGSTGSIGVSTLDVVARRPEQFSIYALVAGNNTDLLAEQISRFRPRMAAVSTE